MRASVSAFLAFLVPCSLLVSASQARADCGTPPFEVVWSYPEKNAQDVPINAQLWLLISWGSTRGSFTLNGSPLTPSSQTHGVMFAPELEPDTDYTLHYETDQITGPEAGSFDLAFRTGTERAAEPDAPVFDGYTIEPNLNDKGCAAAITARDCYDMGENAYVRFASRAPKPQAWLIDPEPGSYGAGGLLPATCDVPTVFTDSRQSAGDCYVVRTVGEGGLVSDGTRVCVDEDEHMASDADAEGAGTSADAGPARASDGGSTGCALGAPGDRSARLGGGLLVMLFALGVRRRRVGG